MEYDESDDADGPNDQPEDKQGEGNDDFGDEFDEFEEGAPADDDFGDFDDGFQQPEEKSESEPQSLPAQKHIPSTESQFVSSTTEYMYTTVNTVLNFMLH